MSIPTHLIMVLNRETHELKLVSAHLAGEAEAAFENLSSLFASTPNDVHKVTVPSECGFVVGEIQSSQGKALASKAQEGDLPPLVNFKTREVLRRDANGMPKNGVHQNARGEYVQKLADGSEIISTSDFGDD